MNKLKALVVMLVMGSSSAAMASPATFSAHGSVSFDIGEPSHRTVVVRDHREYRQPVYVNQRDYRAPEPVYVNYRDYRNGRELRYEQFSLTGTYSSEFGRVELFQHGDRITGSFAAGGGGVIEGRIVGNQIFYKWKGASQRGRGVWTLTGPNRLEGTWGNGRNDFDGGAWNLRR